MDSERKLNIDVGQSISALRYFLKRFDVMSKKYKIFFRGKSFDFEGFRDFTPDDDVSSVDWKTSSRSGKLLVRQYKEEEDKKIVFVLDIGENMVFGSTEKLKCEYAAELVLSLTDIIINVNDRAGLILYNDEVRNFFVPRRGTQQFNIFLDLLSNPKNYKGGSNISSALDFILQNFNNSTCTIVLVSDFLNFSKKDKHNISLLSSRYETLAFMIKDPLDKTLPDVSGEFIIENPFTKDQLLIEPKLARKEYERHAEKQAKFVREAFRSADVDCLELVTDKPFSFDVINFIQERVRKKVIFK